MKIIDCYFDPFIETDYKKVPKEELDILDSMIE